MRVLLFSEGDHELSGALQNLVRRVSGKDWAIEAKTVRDPELTVHPGKGKGMYKRAMRCILYAERENYDAVIMVIDQDDEPDRHRQLNQAQDEPTRKLIPRALGVAVRTFDAWMLADEQALTSALKYPIQRRSNPESIHDAKSHCRDLCKQAAAAPNLADLYNSLSSLIQLNLLEERCPTGFAPFAARVRKIH